MRKTKHEPAVTETAETIAEVADASLSSSLAEVESHLRAFIAAFILPRAQPRWVEFLIDRRDEWDTTPRGPKSRKVRSKATDVLRGFAADVRYCVPVPNARRTAACYEATFGKAHGVYFELGSPPCRLTAVAADEKFSWEDKSALLSFEAGKKALFFCHDGGVWKCERA